MAGKRLRDTRAACDYIEYTRRQASFQGNLTQLERGKWCFNGWFEYNGIAGSQCRANLPGSHHERIVPRGQRSDHADRLATNDASMTAAVFAGCCASQVAGRTREEMQVIDSEWNVAIACQLDRLTSVLSFQFGQLRSMGFYGHCQFFQCS